MAFERTYTLRQRLNSNLSGPLFMAGVTFFSTELVELIGYAGFDIIMVDAEHGMISAREIQDMIRAADVAGVPAIVRPPLITADHVNRALDAGAAGILAAHVSTADQAEALVRESRYPPQGTRGTGNLARAYRYSLDSEVEAYSAANEGIVRGALIETIEGVKNAEAIMRTDGIDFAFLGPSDLSADRGTFRRDEDPGVRSAIRKVAEVGRSCGVPVMTRGATADRVAEYWGYGYQVLLVPITTFIARSCVEWLTSAKAAAAGVGRSVELGSM